MSDVDSFFNAAIDDTGSSPLRVYAPMPKRRRGNDTSSIDGDSTHSVSPLVAHKLLTTSELGKAAEELLNQFDMGHRLGNDRSVGCSPGRRNLPLEGGFDYHHDRHDHHDNHPDGAKSHEHGHAHAHDCEHNGCYEYRSSYVMDDDRLGDDYHTRGGGKKRKVPASAQQGPSGGTDRSDPGGGGGGGGHTCGHTCNHSCGHSCGDYTDDGEDDEDVGHDQTCPHSHPEYCEYHSRKLVVPKDPHLRMTPIRRAIAFERRLLKARKAQILGLHADAEACITASKQKLSTVPTKDELEELAEALEYAGVTAWEGDRVGIGAGIWEGQGVRPRGAEGELAPGEVKGIRWKRRGRALERWKWLNRKPIKRGGWVPEGSFEYEMKSPVSSALTRADKQLSLLRSKVTYLLTLTLTSPVASASKPLTSNPPPERTGHVDTKTTHKSSGTKVKSDTAAPPPTDTSSNPTLTNKSSSNGSNVTVEPTVDDPDYVPTTSKKGKKKKKRSAIANAANPHHVKNYIPSRRPAPPPPRDPLTLPDLINFLFFPPPTRFLSARPGKAASAATTDVPPKASPDPDADGADEYVCCFCEYDLFFGSEAGMDKAIRRRKKLLDRKEKVHEKAKGVVDGKGMGKKKPAKAESDCEGGHACRCAEIRAERKARKGRKKKEHLASSSEGTSHVRELDTPPADAADVLPDVQSFDVDEGSTPGHNKHQGAKEEPVERPRSSSPPDTVASAASGPSTANLE